MKQIPKKLPGLRWATALLGVYAAVWMPLEGNLPLTILLAVWATAVAAGYLIQQKLGGESLSAWQWVGLTAVSGLLMGLSAGILTLVFMALKTGLHDHGPEFGRGEIDWVIQRIPIWMGAGALSGGGWGLLTAPREK